MKPIIPQPWHPEALRLKAEGSLTYQQIAERCSVSVTTVNCLLNPGYRERRAACRVAHRKERYRADPEFRKRMLWNSKRHALRKSAQREAAESGRPVEELYAAWGVA